MDMPEEAIVLAGGLGTRLRAVVQDVPKPMAEVAGKPFLDYILFFLAQNKVRKVILAVGYQHQIIQQYYKGRAPFGVELAYSIETELLGTGGAIVQAAESVTNEDFFILNGDTFFEVNLQELSRFARQQNAELALALKEMPQSDRYGSVGCARDHRLTTFKEKQPGQKQDLLINGGVYYMKKDLLAKFAMPRKFSFEVDFLQNHLTEIQGYGKVFPGTFIDIGIPEDFYYAQTLLKDVITI